jgi:hypothetical protein
VTTVVMVPVPGPDSTAESARKMRAASGGADGVFQLSLRGTGLTVLHLHRSDDLQRRHALHRPRWSGDTTTDVDHQHDPANLQHSTNANVST